MLKGQNREADCLVIVVMIRDLRTSRNTGNCLII